jgi:hypothetical protein
MRGVARTGLLLGGLLLAGAVQAADWEPVTTELLKKEKTGFGGLCGVVVDRKTGGLIVDLSDRGLFRSADGGKTWEPLGEPFKGRTETPGCMLIDPTGKSRRLVVPLVYGSPVLLGDADKPEWKKCDAKSSHVDWCAVAWGDPESRFLLALKHESGGMLIASQDGGKTFSEVGKGHGPAWVFDNKTAVVAEAKSKERPKPNLLRTTDGGKTWQPCGAYTVQALPRPHGDTLYWLTDDALIATTDKGESWKKVCDLPGGRYGPVFGKDAKHLFVLTNMGVVESTDGGATWSKPLPPPKGLGGLSTLTWLDYDPAADALYLMKMGSELYRLGRK